MSMKNPSAPPLSVIKENFLTTEGHSVFFRCVEDCSEAIMITDKKAQLIYVNPAWCETYGYSKQEALGKTPALIRSGLQSQKFYKDMWDTITRNGQWKGELVNVAKDGKLIPVMLTGCGIPPENLKRIFDPFFTTKDIGKGTGLGLAIVSKLASEMNAKISPSSVWGQGTTITLSFPK